MRQATSTLAAFLVGLAGLPVAAAPVDFSKQIAPLLSRKCIHCHNTRQPKGKLSLDSVAAARRGGESGPAIVPGKPDDSPLVEMISGSKPEMPRNDTPLTPSEVKLVRQWILEGAKWPKSLKLNSTFRPSSQWWSLQPIRQVALPKLPSHLAHKRLTPIDAFILARLNKLGLDYSPPANRRTLIRRLSFNLRGLPPTPQEIEHFLRDKSPLAYERLVDRYLASPQYGERWGRHWLDVVHYGDTHGYDKDKVRPHSYPYRDYVIRSFNGDKSYRRFVEEQIAGDIKFPGTRDGVVGTGFIAAGPWDFVGHVELRESLIDKQITRLLDRDDMVATTINTFVSLTAQCARCHDHKFDPITQEDYYSLQAVFAGVERANRPYYPDPGDAQRLHSLRQQQRKLLQQSRDLDRKILKSLPTRVHQLDRQIVAIKQQTSGAKLPATLQAPSNGYHSHIERQNNVVKWVQVDLGRPQPIQHIALVGAFIRYGGHPGPGFGFPLRFRIDISNDATFRSKTCVADHTSSDVPNPGERPIVVATAKNTTARYVRVTATRLWKRTNDYIFALSELVVLNGENNVALGKKVTALDSIEAGVKSWTKRNLVDGVMSRTSWQDLASGKKLKSKNNGYHSAIMSRANHEKWVQVDLGRQLLVDEIRLLPARPTDFPDTPGFGFPVRFKVLLSADASFEKATVIRDETGADFPNPKNQAVTIRLQKSRPGRFVRLLATRLWKRTNDYTLALGEMQVFSERRNVARSRPVQALDSIEHGLWSKRHLVDGFDSRRFVETPAQMMLSFRPPTSGKTLAKLVNQRRLLFEAAVRPQLRQQQSLIKRGLHQIAAQIGQLAKPQMVYAAASSFKRQGNFVPPPNGRPRTIHVLRRGDIKQPMKVVQPGTVSCLPQLRSRFGSAKSLDGPRRVALANWIVDKRNPLTWRSIVNRIWHYHFGRGLVDSPNDFGRMGSKPTHPQLLDWLAADFRDNGQSLKRLHRLIVTSAVYRQSSAHHPESSAKDASNRFLWRMNRRRLDAESIRDAVLVAAGKMNSHMYGPGFRPFGFKNDHSPQYRYAEHDPHDPQTQRRSVYRFLVRSVPDPFMETLDCADPSMTVEKRNETITPLQALALLNNKFMVVMSGNFAKRVARATPDPSQQLRLAMRVAVGRPPEKSELQTLLEYRRKHGLANTCRLLLNLNEFVFVD